MDFDSELEFERAFIKQLFEKGWETTVLKNKTEKESQKTNDVEEFINQKIANSENGIIYMNDKDMKTIMKAAAQNNFTTNINLNLKI